MLTFIRAGSTSFEAAPRELAGWRVPDDAAWIDLCDPTREQELLVEEQLGLAVPTREEMRELEPSSRLYQDRGATYMTAVVLFNAEDPLPNSGPVTFVLTGDDKLVTLRYIEPRSFTLFQSEATRRPICADGAGTLLGLVDAVVERSAQVLEKTATSVDVLATEVFDPTPTDYNAAIAQIGRAQTINANIRESLVSLARLLSFAQLAQPIRSNPSHLARLEEVSRDVQFLLDQAAFETGNVGFLLDATLGLINNAQNNTIRFLTVAGSAFLPPTFLASMWGMNFEHMPEL
ncbi:MAG: magnesium transporter, partial [Pseudomonadota bacterium]|nr:magnesium transporter [Pseudomonadota bacterium]